MDSRPTRNLLVVDDEPGIRHSLSRYFCAVGFSVIECESCASVRAELGRTRPDVVIIDYSLPDGTALDVMPDIREAGENIPVILLTGYGSIDLAVRAVKQGAEQFLTKPVELATLKVVVERALENQRNRNTQSARSRRTKQRIDPFQGESGVIRTLAEQSQRISTSDCPVLILGETGVGKGVLARWLHEHSLRRSEALVDVNCAGLSRELLESELFGHEKGSFTGAVTAKPGLFECAHRGTLFLDEIGDMDLQIQPKLLKALDDKRFRRLGEIRDRYSDVRLIAATHQNLAARMREGKFRSDLYFRISTVVLRVPPLRERREDIPQLADTILKDISVEIGRPTPSFERAAMQALVSYAWPGNVRELRNVIERAVLLGASGVIRRRDLDFEPTITMGSVDESQLTLREVEQRHILRVLEQEQGNVPRAAKRLDMPRSTLYMRLKEMNESSRAENDDSESLSNLGEA